MTKMNFEHWKERVKEFLMNVINIIVIGKHENLKIYVIIAEGEKMQHIVWECMTSANTYF